MRSFLMGLCLTLAIATPTAAQDLVERKGWEVANTSAGYEELVDHLVAAVKSERMIVVTQASASAGAKGRGLTIPGNRVIGVYRNDYAVRMLEASVAAGIEAPIRFYVTENADGTATLSWKKPSFVFEPYMNEGGEELADLAAELDDVFQTIAEKAVASK
ncbi:DUF302 domain-containing protein [Rhodobacterales bacterium]|nr:DUF302 domain-containing protein [Rhodobacterales bacterium]